MEHLTSKDSRTVSSDQRAYPRKPCEIQTHQGQIIRNLSLGGLLFEGPSRDYDINQELDFSFTLPASSSRIQARGRVVHASSEGYGCAFTKIQGRDQRRLKHYLLNRIKKEELASLRQKFQKAYNVIELSDPARIRALLKGAAEETVNLVVFQTNTHEEYIEGEITFVDDTQFHFKSRPGLLLDNIRFDDTFSLVFDYHYHGYYLETHLESASKTKLAFSLPLKICYSDRRQGDRRLVPGGSVQFPLPYPEGETYEAALVDLSEGGFSFKASKGGCYFLPGTPLRDLKIRTEGSVSHHPRAEVRHLGPLSETHLKIGAEFARIERANVPIVQAPQTSQKRLAGKLLKGLFEKVQAGLYLALHREKAAEGHSDKDIHVVRFKNTKGQEIVGLINATEDLRQRRIRAPVVIIPTAYAKRKELLSGLALTLTKNFRGRSEPLVVLRFDSTNATGESYIDEEARRDGMNYLNFLASSTIGDLQAAIEFCANNRYFQADGITLISFSFTSPFARRAIIQDLPRRRVRSWINAMGTPYLQELIKNSGGGVDYLGNFAKGVKPGIINFLGEIGNWDPFCQDCIDSKVAFLEEARSDLAQIDLPVTWIYGKYDNWVDPRTIRDVMSVRAPAEREIIEVPSGHLPSTTDEALRNFTLITRCLWKQIHGTEIDPQTPPLIDLARVWKKEWGRIPKRRIEDTQAYWKTYLLGKDQKEVGFDILSLTDEYQDLMRLQLDLLDIKPTDRVADMGTGTGNAFEIYLRWKGEQGVRDLSKGEFHQFDFIEEALQKAEQKHRACLKESTLIPPTLKYTSLNLELSRLVPFLRFLRGELHNVEELTGMVDGLNELTIEGWTSRYSKTLHKILRGKTADLTDLQYLDENFSDKEVETILEFNQAAQVAQNILAKVPQDQVESFAASLKFEHLNFPGDLFRFHYPLEDEGFDKILCSLVLSYVYNPAEIVREFYRLLKPGGKLVFSSFRPDADMTCCSTQFKKLAALTHSPIPGMTKDELLKAAHAYISDAARLIHLGEEGVFKFFSLDEMKGLLIDAGFRNIEMGKSFGNPPQVNLVSGQKLVLNS